jgi:protein-disulfide isomerase
MAVKEIEENSEKELPSNLNVWKVSTIAVIIILGIVLVFSFGPGGMAVTGKATSVGSKAAADKAIKYINDNLVSPGTTATFVNVTEENGLYKITTNYQNQDISIYSSLDGKYLFLSPPLDMNKAIETAEPATAEMPKTDTPEVEVFVMSYCPYGTQAQAAMIPVARLLGDKANIKIRFVDYAMHGKKEVDENTRQYCIQKEQSNKLWNYLECFISSDDTEACQSTAGIDTTKLNACVAATDEEFNITGLYNDKSTWSGGQYPQYNVDTALNSRYGVQGSPTLIINGVTYSGARSPEAFKTAICSAFNTSPAECEQELGSGQATASGGCAS